jgi:hypothetical protein
MIYIPKDTENKQGEKKQEEEVTDTGIDVGTVAADPKNFTIWLSGHNDHP